MALKQLLNSLRKIVPIDAVDETYVVSASREISVGKGEVLHSEGSLCHKYWFLSNGCIRQYCVKNGRECTINIFSRQRFFTDLAGIKRNDRSVYSFQALVPSRLVVFEAEKLHCLFDTNIKFERIGRVMYEEVLFDETSRLHDVMVNDATDNYLKLLDGNKDLVTRLPLKTIASYLNITPESLSRIRRSLKSKEL